MSAALTSSTFVGAKVSVAKTTTVSKRAAFSVQANASGPKRVRIPISFFFLSFFCTLKSSLSRVRWAKARRTRKCQIVTETKQFGNFVKAYSTRRASFGVDRSTLVRTREYLSSSIARAFERFECVRASARDRFRFIIIYFFIYLIRSFSRLSIRERERERKRGKKEKPIGCTGKEKKMKREKSSEQ